MDNKLPFGYHYDGHSVVIKLRFTLAKFEKLDIAKFGRWRATKSGGHVIFQAQLDARSDQFKSLTNILKASQ